MAPTPSGFLHLGNAVNFLMTWAIVRSRNGKLHLRVDDMDGIRFRQDVLEDIFYSLEWLGVDWDTGPSGPEEFYHTFSLQKKKPDYWERLCGLMEGTDKTFACQCSRSAIKQASSDGLYPGTCRDKGLLFQPGRHAIRLKVDKDTVVRVNETNIDLSGEFGDFVIWRKDDQPSYHLASLLEDEAGGVNLIIRGEDLFFSTAAQVYLASCFGFTGFPSCHFIHHGLVRDCAGEKLSKSRGAFALKDIREAGGTPLAAVRKAARFLGVIEDEVASANDLLRSVAGPVQF